MNVLHKGDIIIVTKPFTLNGKEVIEGKYRVHNPEELIPFWRDHFYRCGISLFGKDYELL